jgi:hypothetical protein
LSNLLKDRDETRRADDGSIPSWHHRLKAAGHAVTAIGKLHFRSGDDDNGFSAADALAKGDQRARIAAFGGREAILARGSFGYSPPPGTKPVYN